MREQILEEQRPSQSWLSERHHLASARTHILWRWIRNKAVTVADVSVFSFDDPAYYATVTGITNDTSDVHTTPATMRRVPNWQQQDYIQMQAADDYDTID